MSWVLVTLWKYTQHLPRKRYRVGHCVCLYNSLYVVGTNLEQTGFFVVLSHLLLKSRVSRLYFFFLLGREIVDLYVGCDTLVVGIATMKLVWTHSTST